MTRKRGGKNENQIIQGKKAISPVISTVLLIMIVIILAIIILLWSRGFIKEKILKFDKPVENVCREVSIKTFVNEDDSYGFTNIGNVPIYGVDVKISKKGGSTIVRANTSEGMVDIGLSTILNTEPIDENTEEIKLIPVLLGQNKDGTIKEYTCPEQSAFVAWKK